MRKNQATTIGIRLQDADGALLAPADIGYSSGEVQRVEFSATPASGTYTVSDGTHTTGGIQYDADAATILAALQAANIPAAAVSDGSRYFSVTFTEVSGDVPTVLVNTSTLYDGESVQIVATVTITAEAVVAVTVELQMDGGIPIAPTNSVYGAGGAMSLLLTAAETECDTLAVTVTATGAIPREYVYSPVAEVTTLDAAGIRSAVGLGSANLDVQIAALPTDAENAAAVWANATRSLTTFGTLPASVAAEVAAIVVETGVDLVDALQRLGALIGKRSGVGTGTESFTGMDGVTPRMTAQSDADGNTSAITYH